MGRKFGEFDNMSAIRQTKTIQSTVTVTINNPLADLSFTKIFFLQMLEKSKFARHSPHQPSRYTGYGCHVHYILTVDDSQLNHSDHDDEDDHDGVKGSSFSFVRSDSTASKDGESSGDENQTQFAFIKEEDVTDDVVDDVPSSKSQEHESIKPEAESVSPSGMCRYILHVHINCI